MNANEIVTTWKKAEQNGATISNVAGEPVIDQQLLEQVQGGGRGWVYTISAECLAGGFRCDFWNW